MKGHREEIERLRDKLEKLQTHLVTIQEDRDHWRTKAINRAATIEDMKRQRQGSADD